MKDSPVSDVALLAARVLMCAIFLLSGWGKIAGYAGTAAHMTAHGLPGALLPLVILTELGGGLAVLLGLFTRWVAIALAGYTVLAALFFHTNFADQNQFINFMKNITIAGGFIALFVAGAGRISLDFRLRGVR